ncbi:synaptotagmin-like protein 2 isoform X2 [Osmerus eperlanus]|uniref:synaptotagmin-like protein 2 isoform X2 n=1 Tax=Osmerus eperlanus TaxID=29151 RepID=UPI002E120B90
MMKSNRDLSEDLDLSFLSTDEEMAIRQVLQRDENLKRQETGRIRRLRLSIPDPKKLKVMTGEWFEELRTCRYGRQSDVTEVVRSSMRRKKTTVPRGSPYRDTRKTDPKGEDMKTDSQTKTSEFKTLNTSFLNPAFREEKVKLELSEEESAANEDVTTVDIPEWKTPPSQKSCEQTSRKGISPNPLLLTKHQDIDYFSTANPDHPSPKPRTLKTSSFPVEEVAPKSQSTLTTESDPSPPPEPGPEPLDDITYLESTRKLVLPPEIKDDPEQRSPTVSVDPNTWTQPAVEDHFIEVNITDKSPDKTPTVVTLPSDSIQGRSAHRFGATMGERVTTESPSGGDTENRSEERPNAGRGVECADHSKSVEGAMQAGPPHLEEVPFEPYNMKHVSKKPNKDPKPEEAQSHSEPSFRSLQSTSEYNPFCTTEVPVSVEGPQQSPQKKAQVSVEPNTWKQREVDGDFIQVNLADEGQSPEKTPKGVTSPSNNTQDSVVTKSSKVPAEVSTQQANQEAGKYPIPTILLNSSQSPITEEVKGLGNRRKVLEVSSVSGSSLGNLENETVDSDDDHTSVSSQGSDFSDRQGYGSTLSLSHSGRTGSMLSVYSDAGDFGNVTVQGAVEFALRYSKEGEFIVTVEQCLDLAFANARKKRTDPYVKTYLHPDKSHSSKKKTSIKKRTTNPVYGGETLKYKIKMEELKGRTLNLSVWHNDSRGRNVFLGQVEINLKTWDWGHEALTWYNMQPKSSEGQEVSENHGVLTVALKYLPPGSAGIARPDSGEIHVWLKEARELRKLKAQGVDSFVKCYMLPDTSKKSRQKTRVMKKSQEPVYNHAMVYDGFRDDEVREACCELTVWDQNKLSNQFLGGVRLSLGTGQSYGKKVDWMDSWDQEIGLWEKMLASPTSWVEGEMPLRSAMTPRKKSLR